MNQETPENKIFIGKSLRVFVSYSTADKKLAGALKVGLEDYGMDVFLAHEDITPCEEWEQIILRTLKQTDIFMPLLTKNFKNSSWTDQETGIAVSDQKFIISLKVNIDPYGFISKYQAFTFTFKEVPTHGGSYSLCADSCLGIIKLILTNKDLKENLKDCLIRSFINSGSFLDAGSKIIILDEVDSFSKEQIDAVIQGSISNDQINGSFKTKTFLKKFMQKSGKTPIFRLEISRF